MFETVALGRRCGDKEYAELARGIEVKRLSGIAEDQALAGIDALGEHLAEVMQGLRIDATGCILFDKATIA